MESREVMPKEIMRLPFTVCIGDVRSGLNALPFFPDLRQCEN